MVGSGRQWWGGAGRRGGLVLLLQAVVATEVAAEPIESSRQLLLQVDDQGVVGLARMWLPSRRAGWLWLMSDIDRDGRLSTEERAGLAAVVASQSLVGVEIFWDGEPLAKSRARSALEDNPGRGASLGAVGLYRLRSAESFSGPQATHELKIVVARNQLPVWVRVQTMRSWFVDNCTHCQGVAKDRRGLSGPSRLAPGMTMTVQVAGRGIAER